MTGEELELALEALTAARREGDREGRLVPPPLWFDLPPEAFDALHARQALAREVERLLDAEGRTSTARAVLGRLGIA